MGRGEYYKNKYGGGGRGNRNHGNNDHGNSGHGSSNANGYNNKRYRDHAGSDVCSNLYSMLIGMDGKSYNFYKDLKGHTFDYTGNFSMKFENIQGDAFAAPSRLCVTVPLRKSRYPEWSWRSGARCVALADHILRTAASAISEIRADVKTHGSWNEGKGGELRIEKPSQNILLRSTVEIKDRDILLRFCVGLPARGRSICGDWAADICCNTVHKVVTRSCCDDVGDLDRVKECVECYEDQEYMRAQLDERGLVAFVPNGAILPRSAGHLDTPLTGSNVVPFQSPSSLMVDFTRPNKGLISGMGIKRGCTLITGGGFHGKTTLLSALKMGVYSKIPGDGREYLVTTSTATKIRAEDGRSITGVDISCFISNLPQNKDTTVFCSEDASGSTSQAAAIMEYIELGGSCLMIDEDTAATNFMIRDNKIQLLLPASKEPIKPFLYRVRELYQKFGLSTLVVVGGAGDYFDVADRVLLMDSYLAVDVTDKAKEIAAAHPASIPQLEPIVTPKARAIEPRCFSAFAGKVKVDLAGISYSVGETMTKLDLSALEQLVETGQVRFIHEVLRKLSTDAKYSRSSTLKDLLTVLETDINKSGLGCVKEQSDWLSRPRLFELGAAINRYRNLSLRRQ